MTTSCFEREEFVERSNLISTLTVMNGFKNIAEIGVSSGDNARRILRNFSGKFNGYKVDTFSLVDLSELIKDKRYAFKCEGLLHRGVKNVDYYPCGSEDACKLFIDNSIDLIFLDADHSQEAFLPDIKRWWNKLKEGGILIGDEYLAPKSHSCYYRTSELNNEFRDIMSIPEERKSEGYRTHLWWVIK